MTDLVKTSSGAIAIPDYGDDAGRGFENQGKADVSLAWMKLAQGLTPELETLDGLKPGMWFNSITQQVYPRETGFLFVPAITKRAFAKWTPRTEGKGFHGLEDPESDVVLRAINESKEFGKYFVEDPIKGRLALIETFYVYGVVCTEPDENGQSLAEGMAGVAFTKTKIRSYKAWNTRMSSFRMRHPTKGLVPAPMYAHLTRVTSLKDKNDEGEFYVPKMTSADARGLKFSLLDPDDERFLLARQCYELQLAGELKVDYAAEGSASEEPDAPASSPKSGAFV